MYCTSSARSLKLIGTRIRPEPVTANRAMSILAAFGDTIATRSPGATPSRSSAWIMPSHRSITSPYERRPNDPGKPGSSTMPSFRGCTVRARQQKSAVVNWVRISSRMLRADACRCRRAGPACVAAASCCAGRQRYKQSRPRSHTLDLLVDHRLGKAGRPNRFRYGGRPAVVRLESLSRPSQNRSSCLIDRQVGVIGPSEASSAV